MMALPGGPSFSSEPAEAARPRAPAVADAGRRQRRTSAETARPITRAMAEVHGRRLERCTSAARAMTTILALAAGLPIGCARHGSSADTAPRPALIVLYTSDLRGHYAAWGTGAAARGGLARRATLVDQARLQADAIVQVDAGNLLPVAADGGEVADPAALSLRARMVLAAYRRMGVDAVIPGERELSLGLAGLKGLLTETKTHMLAANVAAADGQRLFDGDRLIEIGGHRVGVLGLVDLSGAAAASLAGWGFAVSDAAQAARASAAALRGRGAQLLIAVVHADRGAARAQEILKAAGLFGGAADVDALVVGGGEPSQPSPPTLPAAATEVSRPAILQAGSLGATLGRLDVRWPAGGAPRMETRLVEVGGNIPEQWGVALIGRVVTTHIVDNGRLANEFPAGATDQQRREGFEKWDYGSTEACAACHQREAEQWATTDHAHALETLKAKGHDRDPGCLGCHLTGFLGPGGTRNLKTATTFFANVGCESCHGPSVDHVRSETKHVGTSRKVAEVVCLGCHTPDQNLGPFDYAAALKDVLGPGHGMPDAKPGPAGAPVGNKTTPG
jgi:hypothetical protein